MPPERRYDMVHGVSRQSPKIRYQVYEPHREEISRRYMEYGLKDVMAWLSTKMDTIPSKGQMKTMFKHWGIRKNRTRPDSSPASSHTALPSTNGPVRLHSRQNSDAGPPQDSERIDGHNEQHASHSPNGPNHHQQAGKRRTDHIENGCAFPFRSRGPRDDVVKAADCYFSLGFPEDACAMWQKSLPETTAPVAPRDLPPTLLLYLFLPTINSASGQHRQPLYTGACDCCAHERFSNRFPTLFNQLEALGRAAKILRYDDDLGQGYARRLQGLRALACGWTLPEGDTNEVLSYLKQVCLVQVNGLDRVRERLEWCTQQLKGLRLTPDEQAELDALLSGARHEEMLWLLMVNIWLILWDRWRMQSPIEEALIKWELLGLSTEYLLRILISMVVDSIPFDVFKSVEDSWAVNTCIFLLDAARKSAESLLAGDDEHFYSELSCKILNPRLFNKWPNSQGEVERRRRVRQRVREVVTHHCPTASSNLREEDAQLWTCTSRHSEYIVLKADSALPVRSPGQSTLSNRRLYKRIRRARRSPTPTCTTPRMEVDSQISDDFKALSLKHEQYEERENVAAVEPQ